MKAYKFCLWGVTVLAVVFAIAVLLIPEDQFHMVLDLRNGHQVNPGKWLIVLPVLAVLLNISAFYERRKNPSLRNDWKLLVAELVLMGFCTAEQIIG